MCLGAEGVHAEDSVLEKESVDGWFGDARRLREMAKQTGMHRGSLYSALRKLASGGDGQGAEPLTAGGVYSAEAGKLWRRLAVVAEFA